MKRLHIVMMLGVFCVLLSATALGVDTFTVNFNGQFVAATCNFSVNGRNDVNIGTYANTYFNTSTSTPTVTIPLVATGCSAGISTIHLGFSGAADSSNNQLFAVNGASGVSGVAVELLYNSQTARIAPNSTVNWVGLNPSLPSNTWNFWAHFYKTTGTIAPGTVNIPITINFTYN